MCEYSYFPLINTFKVCLDLITVLVLFLLIFQALRENFDCSKLQETKKFVML